MTTLRCQVGSACKPDRGADARQPDLAVDPRSAIGCPTTAVEDPGSGAPARGRGPAHRSLQAILRDPTSPMVGARRARTCERCARTVTLMRNAASIAVAAKADHGGPTATALWRRFPLSPTLERVRTTDVGSVADWDDHRRRKVVKMILCRESQPGGLSPCLGSGRGRRYARQRSSEPAAPADVAETPQTGMGAGSVLVVGAPARPTSGCRTP